MSDPQPTDLGTILDNIKARLAFLGLSRDGLQFRLLLKALGLPKWEKLTDEQFDFVYRTLESLRPELGLLQLESDIRRIEAAIAELAEGTPGNATAAIVEDQRGTLRRNCDAYLLNLAGQIADEFDGRIAQ